MVRLLLQKGYQNSLIKISVKEFALSLIFTFSFLPSYLYLRCKACMYFRRFIAHPRCITI